jgi:hypothetical protein
MGIDWTATHWQGLDTELGVTVSIIRTKGIGTDRLWHMVVQSPNRDINALSNTYWATETEAKTAVEKRIDEVTT